MANVSPNLVAQDPCVREEDDEKENKRRRKTKKANALERKKRKRNLYAVKISMENADREQQQHQHQHGNEINTAAAAAAPGMEDKEQDRPFVCDAIKRREEEQKFSAAVDGSGNAKVDDFIDREAWEKDNEKQKNKRNVEVFSTCIGSPLMKTSIDNALKKHDLPEGDNHHMQEQLTCIGSGKKRRHKKKSSNIPVTIYQEDKIREVFINKNVDNRAMQCNSEKETSSLFGKPRNKNTKSVSFEDQIFTATGVAISSPLSEQLYADISQVNAYEDQVLDAAKDRNSSPAIEKAVVDKSQANKCEDEFVWGVRFSKEEDELLKDAVKRYIKEKGWTLEKGIQMILNCKKYKEAQNCWTEIRACLPDRPQKAIRHRAYSLLVDRTHNGRWSKEDEETLRRLQKECGLDWKKMTFELGRGRLNIKDKWRNLKRGKGSGKWTQDELQRLSDKVHANLRAQVLPDKKHNRKESDHRILRKNLNWEKIADSLGTHAHGACCAKWYNHLSSSMVSKGEWADEDDFLLLKALLELGANAEEQVDWDNLLERRSGQICFTRWKQMVKHLGENQQKEFVEKAYLLTKRYAPELLEHD